LLARAHGGRQTAGTGAYDDNVIRLGRGRRGSFFMSGLGHRRLGGGLRLLACAC
jgi:hypothetical protein